MQVLAKVVNFSVFVSTKNLVIRSGATFGPDQPVNLHLLDLNIEVRLYYRIKFLLSRIVLDVAHLEAN